MSSNKGPEDIDAKKAQSTADKSQEKLKSFRKDPGVLGAIIDDVGWMISLVSDAARGRYKEVPWTTIAAMTGALIYFISPIDAVPDFIPGAGYVDDAAVLGLCIRSCKHDLERYRAWRATRDGNSSQIA